MYNRKKLLYITDQEEYSEHGTMGPLFNGYLPQHLDVHIVYFTKYKNSFQVKGSDYVLPIQYKKHTCEYMRRKEVDLASFDFVFVRNMLDVLSEVLDVRDRYEYKVGYRVSFPKTQEAYELIKSTKGNSFLKVVSSLFNKVRIKSLLTRCDLFMPTSKDMEDTFYGGTEVRSFPLPSGLDPKRIKPHRTSDGEKRHFIYVGALDKLHEFEMVLTAFSKVEDLGWHLVIATLNLDFAKDVLKKYETILEKITLMQASNLDVLMQKIDDCDVGIALLPDIAVYNTTIPAKVMDYATCALPSILTDNAKNRTLFDDTEALYCNFDASKIVEKIQEVIAMSQEDIVKMGHAGQEKLLNHKRNYQLMAEKLFLELESL